MLFTIIPALPYHRRNVQGGRGRKRNEMELLTIVPERRSIVSPLAWAQASQHDAIKSLKRGNKRFVEGKPTSPNRDLKRIREVANGQNPFAVVVGCSDSRVANEIVFDQGLGDLFVVRTAGQVGTQASWGSIEFAVKILGATLVVVLGHTKCGAVAAAASEEIPEGHMKFLVDSIKPAVKAARKMPGDILDNAVKENIFLQVEILKNLDPILAPRVKDGTLKVVGAIYHVETGEVEFLE